MLITTNTDSGPVKMHQCDVCGARAKGTYHGDSHARPRGWVEHWKNPTLVGDACEKCVDKAKTWEQVRYPDGKPPAAPNPTAVQYDPVDRIPHVGEKVYYRNDDGRTFNAYEVIRKEEVDRLLTHRHIIGIRGADGKKDCIIVKFSDGYNTRLFFRNAKGDAEAPPPRDRSHEECAGCLLEDADPQRCSGHLPGPVPCPEFRAKPVPRTSK